METEPVGRLLARTLVPYVQQWAERSEFTLLSRLLSDEQVREVIEKYGDELATQIAHARSNTGNRHGQRNGRQRDFQADQRVSDLDAEADTLANLDARMQAMEAQQQAVQSLLEAFQAKIRPLALALGSCPECLVGVEGCPKCLGRSWVAHYEPDLALLEMHVVTPLAERGVPLVLKKGEVSSHGRQTDEPPTEPSTRRRRSS